MTLADTLAGVLSAVMSVEAEEDGALTLRHDGTIASLRVVTVAEGLEMVSLTQMLAWDLPVGPDLLKKVVALGQTNMLGAIVVADQTQGQADVLLRYNFPAGNLDEGALQTLVLMVLTAGTAVREALV